MQGPMTFGECLAGIMRRKHISVADLTRRMNYRSKTSISRLLRDEVRYGSIEDFMNRLEPVAAWLMTDEEQRMLRDAMEVSRLGRARYQAYQEIWRLVGEPEERCPEAQTEPFGEARAQTLHELARTWHEAQSIEMMIVNSGYDSLFRELEELLRRNPDKDVSISHYLVMRDAPGLMAEQLGSLMSVFHDPRYQGYYRTWQDDAGPGEIGYGVSKHLAVIRGRRRDGGSLCQVLAMQSEDRCLVYENDQAEGFYEFFGQTIEEACRGALPLKTQYPEQELIEGLIVITRRYLNCEQDRATWCLAPDICFELIPYDILYRVMFDSVLKGFDISDEPIAQLAQIHQARYANIHGKKKPTVFMFGWESLKQFARTGRTTDHVAGMRAFTPQERAAIMMDVVEKCRASAYLRVRILKPDVQARGMTLTTHEALGVYLLDSYTQYDVVNGHSEAFILMPGFAQTLEEFFKDELIAKHTYSEAESLEMLASLAETAKLEQD